MPTIQISDSVHPKGELRQYQAGDHTASGVDAPTDNRRRVRRSSITEGQDGIYNIRSRSAVSPSDRRTRTTFQLQDDDPGLRKEGDFKQKQVLAFSPEVTLSHMDTHPLQVFSGKILFWLTYQSLGVIYGDIGTSPLYVYSSTFSSPPSREDLIGALSLIIWSLFMMVTVKYVFIILRADNNGEGGTFSTYSLLSRYVSYSSLGVTVWDAKMTLRS